MSYEQEGPDAAASSGLMALEFVLEPETWPIFASWADSRSAGLIGRHSLEVFEADRAKLLEMVSEATARLLR